MQSAVLQINQRRAPDPQPDEGRADLYTGIHKAMRALLCDTLVALGRMDGADAADVQATLARLRHAIDLSRQHLHKEDQYVHPAMESRRRGSTAAPRKQHTEHEESFERLEALALRVERTQGAARAAAALELYRAYALFMANDLVHMNLEETENNAVLWAHFEDKELHAVHQNILASIGPTLMTDYLRWMVPAMSPAERVGLIAGMRASLPAEVFAGLLGLVRSVLGEREWTKLLAAFGHQPLAV
jgi:hypothetical protein